MKLNTKPRNVQTQGLGDQTNFKIGVTGKAFEILSSGLYSDKILAIVRELSTNAYDAHVAAGSADKPFSVHLPNKLEPFFAIRDFGTGLSHDDIMTLYTTYFDSTKTDSNLFVGALGLGSKSPFSYTESFTVTSFFGGKKRFYSAHISSDGVPSIALMGENKTDEPNGLEIKIPVAERDFSEFLSRGAKIWQRFNPLPDIKGAPGEFKINPIEYSVTGTGWGMVKDGTIHTGSKAIQGLIAYPINASAIRGELSDFQRMIIERMPVEIEFEIGELDIAANREELGYNDVTIKNIKKKVNVVAKELVANVQAKFDACKTMWEAKKVYADLMGENRYSNPMVALITSKDVNITFKGEHLNTASFHVKLTYEPGDDSNRTLKPNEFTKTVVHGFNVSAHSRAGRVKSRRYSKHTTNDSFYVGVDNDPVLFYNDLGNGAVGRVKHYVDTSIDLGKRMVFLFNCENKVEFNKIKRYMDGAKFRNVSELPKPKRKSSGRGTSNGPNFLNGYAWLNRTRWNSDRDSWGKEEVDLNKGGIYVLTHNFEVLPQDGNTYNLIGVRRFENLVDQARNAGLIDKDATIWGFPRGHSKRVVKHGSWTNLFDLITTKIEQKIKAKNLAQHIADARVWTEFNRVNYRSKERVASLEKLAVMITNKDNAIEDFVSSYRALEDSTKKVNKNVVKLAETLNIKIGSVKPSVDLDVKFDAMIGRFPLIELLTESYEPKTEVLKSVADYVNALN